MQVAVLFFDAGALDFFSYLIVWALDARRKNESLIPLGRLDRVVSPGWLDRTLSPGLLSK